ncbi:MAG: hypothetical protein QOD58_4925 [Mycobacterium sp.]|nr:hypothetical protein [Mycobacterium sp.]
MSDGHKANENPEQHSENKWYNHKPSGLSKAIAALIVYGLFISIDVHDIWPWSRGVAVIVGILATIALLYLEAFATGAIGFLAFSICSAVIVLAGLVVYRAVPEHKIPEIEVIATLQPGNEKAPPNPCDAMIDPNDQSFLKILVGSNAYFGREKATAIKIGASGPNSCDVLTMERTPTGVKVGADLYDADGKLITRIRDKEIHAISGPNSSIERNGDLSTLIVKDGSGAEILFLKYLNQTTIRLRGVFGCPGHATITIKDDKLIGIRPMPGFIMSGSCLAAQNGAIGID